MKGKVKCWMRTAVLIAVLCFLAFPSMAFADSESSLIDLTKTATITASSYETVYGSHGKLKHSPENAVDGDKETVWVSDGKVDSWFMESWDTPQFVDNIDLLFQREGLPFKFEIYGTTADGTKVILLNKLDNTQPLEESYSINVPDEEFVSITVYFDASYDGTEWPAIAELNIYGKTEYSVTFQSGEYGIIDEDDTSLTVLCYDGETFPDLPILTSEDGNYEFEGWMNQEGNIITSFPQTVTSNESYTAIWKKIEAQTEDVQNKTEQNPEQSTVLNSDKSTVSSQTTNEKIDVPKTGDRQDIGLYVGLSISICCIVCILYVKHISDK